jgi:hypothetical protein
MYIHSEQIFVTSLNNGGLVMSIFVSFERKDLGDIYFFN